MKKTLCMLLALCLACAAALPAVGEEIVSAAVEAPVSEARTVGGDNGLSIEVDLPAWEEGEFAVSAADGEDAVVLGPDEAVEEEAELSLTPGQDMAEDAELERAEPAVSWIEMPGETVAETFPVEDDRSPDALFAGYIRPVLFRRGRSVLLATNNSGQKLSGKEWQVYTALKQAVIQIAAGERASTVIEIPTVELLGKTRFTAAEMGVTMEYDADGYATQASMNALSAAYGKLFEMDFGTVMKALWLDCSYELYWFDRYVTGTQRHYPSYMVTYDEDQKDYTVTVMEDDAFTIDMPVMLEYAKDGDQYTVDTALVSKARQAADRARSIVSRYADCSDYAKLYGYAVEVCKLVDYNYDAIAEDDMGNSRWDMINQNPWKLIWVLDGDPDTKVVCEGYALAFSYLCELTAFDSGVRCYMVDGTAYNPGGGGLHAWNVVRMDDGLNYVVDVTWMDGDWADGASVDAAAISATRDSRNADWFLVGGSGSVSEGYTVATRDGGSYRRVYADDAIAANAASALTLAPGKYVLNGFQRVHGDTYYYDDGAHVTGRKTVGGTTYDFGDTGALVATWTPGWHEIDGKRYYFDGNGLHTQHTEEVTPAVPATCEADGKTEGKRCSVCGTVLVEQDAVPALGHLWGSVEYTLSGDGTRMTASRPCVHDAGHVESDTAATIATVILEPTCTREGEMAYAASFPDAAFGAMTLTREIPAKGHAPITDAAVKATCTSTGLTEGSHCSVCHTVLVPQETVPFAPHTPVVDKAVAATCTKSGLTEGKHCSVCGTVIVAQKAVAAKGHTPVTDPAVAATCTDAGKTEGSHCSVCGAVIVAQTTVAAKGHTAVTDPAVAATCTAEGKTEGSHCSVCGEVLVAQKAVAAKGHTAVTDKAVAATTTQTGKTEGKHCSVCGEILQAQKVVPKLTSLAKAKITVKAQVYTGKALKPTVTVKLSGKTLKKGTDYTITYKNNKAVGNATVTVKGKGKYTGTVKKAFRINPKKPTGLTLKAGAKALTAKWKKQTGITGYQVQYATKKSFAGAKTVTLKKAAAVKTTVKKLKSKALYYVRVRAFKTVKKVKYVSAWSKAKTVKVK